MHIYNTDHMSRSGSPGSQMRLMEMRLLGYLSDEPYEGLPSSYLPRTDTNKDELMNLNIFR